jgi:hypothetical protein
LLIKCFKQQTAEIRDAFLNAIGAPVLSLEEELERVDTFFSNAPVDSRLDGGGSDEATNSSEPKVQIPVQLLYEQQLFHIPELLRRFNACEPRATRQIGLVWRGLFPEHQKNICEVLDLPYPGTHSGFFYEKSYAIQKTKRHSVSSYRIIGGIWLGSSIAYGSES